MTKQEPKKHKLHLLSDATLPQAEQKEEHYAQMKGVTEMMVGIIKFLHASGAKNLCVETDKGSLRFLAKEDKEPA